MCITGSNNPFACNPVVFANANSIVSLGTITRDGNQFTFSVGFVWKINGVTYQNTSPVVITIAEASTGFQRIDNALLNTSNSIELQQGLESATIALQPVAPDTNIILTSWNISGDAIEDTQTPIVGNQFVEKSDFNPYNSNVTGTDAIIPLDPNGYSEIRLTNTGLISIAGYDLSLILGNANAKSPYPGKPFIILNLTGHDVVIKKELPAADYPFYFSEESDLVFPKNHYIYATFDPSGFRVIFKSWVDLSIKLDKSTTPSSVYGTDASGDQTMIPVSEFKDVLEFANSGAFPATGESGKIYVALDTNSTYRWSGSAYVEFGGGAQTFEIFWNGQISWQANTNYSIMGISISTWFATFGATQNGALKEPIGRSASRRILYPCKVKSFKMKLTHQNNVTQNLNFYIQKFGIGAGQVVVDVVDLATVNLTTSIFPANGSNFNIPDSAVTLNTSTIIGENECISIVVQNATGTASFIGSYDINIEFEKV